MFIILGISIILKYTILISEFLEKIMKNILFFKEL